MPIACFVGNPGWGKTLGMTWRLYELYKQGHPIYSNYDLSFPHYKIETLEDLLGIKSEGKKEAVVALDEFWRWLDSRKWKTGKSDAITEVVMYSRKRGFWVFYTVQKFHMMTKRVRDVTDFVIEPELSARRIIPFQGKPQEIPLKCILTWRSVQKYGQSYKLSRVPFKVQKFCPLVIMTLYDTHQEVKMI